MDGTDIKVRSIRADGESYEKFKSISEEFPNQARALAALISVYEVERSKAFLPERLTEIESFSTIMQKANELYNHSLMLNHDAEQRIRIEFEHQLTSKDETIRNLQERVKGAEILKQDADVEMKALKDNERINRNLIAELQQDKKTALDEKSKNDNIIKNLTEITTEYKEQAKENGILKQEIQTQERQLVELRKQIHDLTLSIESKDLEIERLKTSHEKELQRLESESEKKSNFFKEQTELEKNRELLEIKDGFNQKLASIHEDYQNRINDLLRQREQIYRIGSDNKDMGNDLTSSYSAKQPELGI